jgi:MtrB/PioB family decaheme-associated outer membrane protein
MNKLIALAALFWAVPALAQTPSTPPAVEVSGSMTQGVHQFDNTTNSSKLTEYRDLRDGFYVPSLTLLVKSPQTGAFFQIKAANVGRNDQKIVAAGGRPGTWNLALDWTGIPHNYSNKAVTPYIRRGPGLFEVPATVPITFKKLATGSADVPGVLASDSLIAAYQSRYLKPTTLGTQIDAGHFVAEWSGSDAITLAIAFDRREKSGMKSTSGPIGDRPPRTLNIQLTEPVDYRTNDTTVSAEHVGQRYQIRGEYLFSDFANGIDTLQWQNVFATPASGATFDAWDRSVSAFGVRPLPPDNRYHNVSATFGGDLPLDSRLTASTAYGRFEQNGQLLPYSYNSDQLAVKTLPRSTADARINTLNFTTEYVISPVRRLNLRTFYRRYDLKNETPSSQWQYVTSDTSNLNGTVSYANKRVSLPFAWNRQSGGVDATVRFPGRSNLTVGFEREAIVRTYREADTTEDILRAAWRTRAAHWMSVEARYLQGVRDGGVYDNLVTREGYWYTQADRPDNNNPLLTFDNHPDMRRFDVSDRLRRQFDFRLNLTPGDIIAVSAFARYRKDDFESDVRPSQPLLGTGLADQAAITPGDQLGRLNDTRTRYGLDMFAQPTDRVALNAFINYDKGAGLERSIEFNENNKANPSTIANAELGPWTRASSQWTADFADRTWSSGLGATVQLIPERLTLVADYTASLAAVDITYAGFGLTNFDGTPFSSTHQFGFSSPPTIQEDLHVVNLSLEIPLRTVTLLTSYTYQNYVLEDWQQDSAAPWVEAVGAETLLRDTSRSHQWGNRLFNLGTYLAPTYQAHIGFVGLRYGF